MVLYKALYVSITSSLFIGWFKALCHWYCFVIWYNISWEGCLKSSQLDDQFFVFHNLIILTDFALIAMLLKFKMVYLLELKLLSFCSGHFILNNLFTLNFICFIFITTSSSESQSIFFICFMSWLTHYGHFIMCFNILYYITGIFIRHCEILLCIWGRWVLLST